MKKRKSIKGSQTPSPTPIPVDPNDLQPECIRVDKVYDWVFFANRYENKNFIPDEECREAVNAALAAGERVEVQCSAPDPDDVICSSTIVENGNPGIVSIVWTVPVEVTILIMGEAVCTFTVRTQFTDELALCVPVGITNEHINCRATQVICSTGGVLMGPDPFGPMIPVKVVLCKDVQVEFPVKLEVLAKFCFPRPNNIRIPEEKIRCDLNLLEFPQQCDFFPVDNCECQATAVTFNAPTTATIGTEDVAGNSDIRAEICQECSLGDSSLTYTFRDTTISPTLAPTPTPLDNDFSFTFTAKTFEQVDCGASSLTAQGEGVRFFDGVPEQVFYSLFINDATQQFQLFLENTAGELVFDSGLVSALIDFSECETFNDLLDD
ncbi:BMQ_0737 family morphogenetic spore coat protein [Metabacillus arenae]|uniref:Uncharacterized protein n=1 Tax=Metabacillus arenae TaxID=2771434 RepID=A0A926NCG5_9BACI|nr:hypothetical protein [Metabacillus arenae]MBD1378999.1 hypothetical protein [Metabacillus arenae]